MCWTVVAATSQLARVVVPACFLAFTVSPYFGVLILTMNQLDGSLLLMIPFKIMICDLRKKTDLQSPFLFMRTAHFQQASRFNNIFSGSYLAMNDTTNSTSTTLPYTDIIFGLIETLCFVIGAPGSTLILSFLLRAKRRPASGKSASTFLYICISFNDIIISVLNVFMAVSNFRGGKEFPCKAWGFMWEMSAKMSISLIAVLSIARTISLSFPFKKVDRVDVIIPVLVLMCVLVFENSLPFLFGEKKGYWFEPRAYYCMHLLQDLFTEGSVTYWVYYVITQINLFLPFIAVVFSCCVSVWKLRAEGECTGGQGKKDATMTILILTAGYVFFNAWICFWKIVLIWNESATFVFFFELLGSKDENLFLATKFFDVNTVGLNSVFNVIVYSTRVKGYQKYLKHNGFAIRKGVSRLISIVRRQDKGEKIEMHENISAVLSDNF